VVNALWFLDPLARATGVPDPAALFRLPSRAAGLRLTLTCWRVWPSWTYGCAGNMKLFHRLPISSSVLASSRAASANAI